MKCEVKVKVKPIRCFHVKSRTLRVVLTRKGIDAIYKAYNKRRKKRTDISDDETEASADEGRADPGTAESEQTRRARRGREQDVAEISR